MRYLSLRQTFAYHVGPRSGSFRAWRRRKACHRTEMRPLASSLQGAFSHGDSVVTPVRTARMHAPSGVFVYRTVRAAPRERAGELRDGHATHVCGCRFATNCRQSNRPSHAKSPARPVASGTATSRASPSRVLSRGTRGELRGARDGRSMPTSTTGGQRRPTARCPHATRAAPVASVRAATVTPAATIAPATPVTPVNPAALVAPCRSPPSHAASARPGGAATTGQIKALGAAGGSQTNRPCKMARVTARVYP